MCLAQSTKLLRRTWRHFCPVEKKTALVSGDTGEKNFKKETVLDDIEGMSAVIDLRKALLDTMFSLVFGILRPYYFFGGAATTTIAPWWKNQTSNLV